MIATRTYIEGLVTGLAVDNGITFKEGSDFHTDIHKKEITYNMPILTSVNFLAAKGLLIHETGHCNYTIDSKETELQKKYPRIMQLLYNAFEDMRIEDRMVQKYGEFAKEALIETGIYGSETVVEEIQTNGIQSKIGQIMLTILADNNLYGHSDRATSQYAQYLYQIIKEACTEKEKLEKLNDLNPITTVKRFSNTEEVKKWVDEKVYPILKELIEKEEKQQEMMQQLAKLMIDGLEKIASEIKSKMKPDKATKGSPEGHRIESQVQLPQDKDLDLLYSGYIRTLAQKLDGILKEKKAIKYTGAYLQGKLLSKNAYKVLTDTKRMFSKRNKPEKPDYVVTFLLDESGSMSGKRHTNTYMAAYLLHQTGKKLGFKVNIVMFDELVRTGQISDYREMRSGGNDDFRAFKKVESLLDLKQDNILFVMTDGGVSNNPTSVREKLEKQGVTVITIGVGLGEEQTKELRRYYPSAISVPDTEQLPNVLIAEMKRVIHR